MRVSLQKDTDNNQVVVSVSPDDDLNSELKESHTFPLQKYEKDRHTFIEIFSHAPPNTVTVPLRKYGKKLFEALFQKESYSRELLQKISPPHRTGRILLELNDQDDLDNIPWEYAWAGKDYLVRQLMFTRVLKGEELELLKLPPRIVVVVPDPIDAHEVQLADLHLNDQFQNFIDNYQANHKQVMLERVFPPTVDRMEALLTRNHETATVLHFMGHCTEDENGNRALVFEHGDSGKHDIADIMRLLGIPENLRLAFFSACNTREVARIIAQQGVPYSIGSYCSIPDDIARKFEAKFYQCITDGYSIEKAMWRTRAAFIANDDYRQRDYLPGAMILYSSTPWPSDGMFRCDNGEPTVDFNMPPNNLEIITTTSRFYGRRTELANLYTTLYRMATRKKQAHCVVTVTGISGQGKTMLAVEVVNRTAHFFPGGIFAWQFDDCAAISAKDYLWGLVEVLFSRDAQEMLRLRSGNDDVKKLGQAIFKQFPKSSCLLILDHADTLKRAETRGEEDAVDLVTWLKEAIWRPDIAVKILATSNENLGLPGEEPIHLRGLVDSDIDSACKLFIQNLTTIVRKRMQKEENENTRHLMHDFVTRMNGHPLSLELVAQVASQPKHYDKRLEDIVHKHYLKMLAEGNIEAKRLEKGFRPMIEALPEQQRELLYICSLFSGLITKDKITAVGELVNYNMPYSENVGAFGVSDVDKNLQQLYYRELLLKGSNDTYKNHVAVAEVAKQLDTLLKARMYRADDGYTLLHKAAEFEQTEIMSILVADFEVDINTKTLDGVTPLHLAVEKGHIEAVKLLGSEFNANVNAEKNNGYTPLHVAAENGHVEMVKLLVSDLCADLNARVGGGLTPLHVAVQKGHTEVVKLLVSELGADTNITFDSLTLLHSAAKNNHVELVKFLLSVPGTDLNARTSIGCTPLFIAVISGNIEIVELLGRFGADTTVKILNGYVPLHEAVSQGNIDIVRLLVSELGADINAKGKDGATPLMVASCFSQIEIIKLLVSLGADMKVKSDDGSTLLHVAAQQGHVELVKYLVAELGADTRAKNNIDYTPLFFAAYMGHVEVVKLLGSEFRAEVNVKDGKGYTPLHEAAGKGYIEMVKLLVKLGAEVNTQADDGGTPLLMAAQSGQTEMVKLLVGEYCANMDIKSNEGWTPLLLAAKMGHTGLVKYLVSEFGVDTNNDRNIYGCTSVYLAALMGHAEVVKLLAEDYKADVNIQNSNGYSPLYIAVERGHMEVVKLLVSELGADINAKIYSDYATPLHNAAYNGYDEMAKFLVRNGADKNAQLITGQKPIDVARQRGHKAMEIVLK